MQKKTPPVPPIVLRFIKERLALATAMCIKNTMEQQEEELLKKGKKITRTTIARNPHNNNKERIYRGASSTRMI